MSSEAAINAEILEKTNLNENLNKSFTSFNLPFGKRIKTINLFLLDYHRKHNQEIMTLQQETVHII